MINKAVFNMRTPIRVITRFLAIFSVSALCSAASFNIAESSEHTKNPAKAEGVALQADSIHPHKVRSSARSQDFNSGWKFHLEDDAGFKKIDFDDRKWRSLRLPHDWSIELPFEQNLDGATAYLPGGIGWYRKSFSTPEAASDKKTYLYFDGIYNHSEIWLNEKKIGGRINGYTPFYLDISPYLAAEGAHNLLAVRVDRSRYIDSRWYPGSGIYRDVKLVTVDPLHIPIWGVAITTPVIEKQRAEVLLDVEVMNERVAAAEFTVRTEVFDGLGKRVARGETEAKLVAGKHKVLQQKLNIDKPDLWSLETPSLYSAKTSIFVNDKLVDQVTNRFGVRSLRYDADKGFFLNGKPTPIKGVNLHHDAGLVGVAVPEDVWRRRLQMLKDAGTNAIRTAHNPASQQFLDLCDEMGFLVQAEIFDEWDNPKDKRLNQWERHSDRISRGYADYFQQEAESDLKLSVKRDRNHPSIIMWSIGNEIEWTYPRYKDATGYFDMNASGNYFYNPPFITEQEINDRFHGSEEGEYVLAKTAKKLSGWVKELDTSRPVTANLILPSVSHISGYTEALDVVGYSYRRVIYDYGHQRYPEKMIMGTENVVQWHEWKAIEEREFIPGTFLWTGTDYLGEAHDAWPRKAVRSGLLDLAGFDTPAFHLFKTLWNPQPHVYLTTQTEDLSLYRSNPEGPAGSVVEKDPGAWEQRVWGWHEVNRHWNYAEGANTVVEVLSNCPRVELFLNGESQGVRKLSQQPDRAFKWALPFTVGRLSAKGLDGCNAESTLMTAGKPVAVEVTMDKHTLAANGYSVAHITAQLIDQKGNPVRHQDAAIEFELPDTLEMVGTDNGRSSLMEGYRSNRLRTSEGRALLIARAVADEDENANAEVARPVSVDVKLGALIQP